MRCKQLNLSPLFSQLLMALHLLFTKHISLILIKEYEQQQQDEEEEWKDDERIQEIVYRLN